MVLMVLVLNVVGASIVVGPGAGDVPGTDVGLGVDPGAGVVLDVNSMGKALIENAVLIQKLNLFLWNPLIVQ